MKASESRITNFLEKSKTQFIIPIYQRNYNWRGNKECKELLNNILEVSYDDKLKEHFIGSIVFVSDEHDLSSIIKELVIIDGQQRLTTLILIYLAIYRIAKKLGEEKKADEINELYLINKFGDEDKKLKLRPSENNDSALEYLFRNDATEEFKTFSNLINNFEYFKNHINENNYKDILKGLEKLTFVEICLNRSSDNPQRIFESLNSTGLKLNQGDLIRNYILMGLKPKDQNMIYKKYWEVIEKLAKDESHNKNIVDDFIRDYLTLENKIIPNKGNVYIEFKKKYDISKMNLDELEDILQKIKSLSKYYNKLVNPKNEKDEEIQRELSYIKSLEINVAHPFLMKVYEDFGEEKINKEVFLKVLRLVQVFTFRRFICGIGTSALNKIFMTLYGKIKDDNYLYSIQKELLSLKSNQRFPKNDEVIELLKIKDVYNIKPKNRNYLLEKLENYENNEKAVIGEDITIEHIFPQTPSQEWKEDLTEEDYNIINEKYVNTISNLTLSGYNGNLSNKSFLEKRNMNIDGGEQGYKYSRFWLNKYIGKIDEWSLSEIENRFEIIKEKFLSVWKYPDIKIEESDRGEEVNIFDAVSPKGKKLEHAIFYGEKLEINTVSELYGEVFEKLFDLNPEAFIDKELGNNIKLSRDINNFHKPKTIIENEYYIEKAYSSEDKFIKIKEWLEVFNLEDELFIKYKTEEEF